MEYTRMPRPLRAGFTALYRRSQIRIVSEERPVNLDAVFIVTSNEHPYVVLDIALTWVAPSSTIYPKP